jgi:hypothetical protein
MSLKFCRIENVLCFPFRRLTMQLLEYVNTSGTHTRDFQLQHIFPQAPLLYTIPAIQLLTTPTHTSTLLLSANVSPPLHPTAHNHGYYAVADYSSAAILSPRLCSRSPENDEKGQIFWVHTHPTVSSRPRGRYVQSMLQSGSEMWICMRYKHTHTN